MSAEDFRPHTNRKICEYAVLGRVNYPQAWELQDALAKDIAEDRRAPILLLLEHPHTFTMGRSGHQENLLWSEEQLLAHDVELHWVDRGGDITYHGPGQLVGYPLLPLGRVDIDGHLPSADYVGYLRHLEEALIRTLATFGLVTGQVSGLTGVWVQPDVASRCPHCPPQSRHKPSKLAAIGVKVDARGVSRHGFALNIDPDMSFFQGIVPCGLLGHPVVSLAEVMWTPPTLDAVAEAFIDSFGDSFGYEMRPAPLQSVTASGT
jgi:lipoyl(octanoyl) transferase